MTAGQAGIQVDRGSATDYQFLFVEATDTFRIGEVGSLQAVATREDTPESWGVSYWNDTQKRLDTDSKFLFHPTVDAKFVVDNNVKSSGLVMDLDTLTLTVEDTGVADVASLEITDTAIVQSIDSVSQLTVNSNGITLSSGASVNEILDSGDVINAASTDNQLATAALLYNELEEIADQLVDVKAVSVDSTASAGDVVLVNTAGGNVNIDLQEEANCKLIIKKVTADANEVIVSGLGTIDGAASVSIDTQYQAITFICDGTNWYIV